jgi:hypothetical protein
MILLFIIFMFFFTYEVGQISHMKGKESKAQAAKPPASDSRGNDGTIGWSDFSEP